MKKAPMLVVSLLQKIAPKIGAKIVMEPVWNYTGQIIFKNGAKQYFRKGSLDINFMGSSTLSKDKDFSSFFLNNMGYPVVEGKVFFRDEIAASVGSTDTLDPAYLYAKNLGFPLIVKPNSGSQGQGVALVYNKKEFYRAMKVIFKRDNVALVQRQVQGKDYRIVVLNGKVISAYERLPLSIVGDGKSTILKLLQQKQQYFDSIERDTVIKIEDPRIPEKLKRAGLTLTSVIDKNEKVFLLDNANLSCGGDAIDVTHTMHKAFKDIAVRIAADMALRLCGVDIMVDGDISDAPGRYWVLEINSAPGLDHYAKTGKEQEKMVEDMYLEVLKTMEEMSEK